MFKATTPLLGAALFAASTLLYAQAPAAPGPGAQGRPAARFDCSKAADPKACEERRAKVRQGYDKAKSACEGKQGPERRDCIRHEMCAQSKDPARCEARAREFGERRRQAAEACKGKQGDALRSCMREQRRATKK